MEKLKTFAFTGCFTPIPGTEDEKKPRLCYAIAIAIAVGTLIYMFLELSGHKFII